MSKKIVIYISTFFLSFFLHLLFIVRFSPFARVYIFCNCRDRLRCVCDTAAPVRTRKLRREVARRWLDEIFNSKLVWRLVIRLYKYAWVPTTYIHIQTVSSYLQSFAVANPHHAFYHFDMTSHRESEMKSSHSHSHTGTLLLMNQK